MLNNSLLVKQVYYIFSHQVLGMFWKHLYEASQFQCTRNVTERLVSNVRL